MIERFHRASQRPCKEMTAMLLYQANPLGIELCFHSNTFFCSSNPIWLLVTWVKTLFIKEPKGRDSRKQIVIFKKVMTFFNFEDMFRCYKHHRQLQNIWKTVRTYITTLIDRVFKINNTWLGFHKDIVNLVFILRKNLFPVHLIDKCVYRYLNTAIDRNGSIQNTTSQGKQYFYKLPYLGRFSTIAQSKIRRLVNRYCHDH